MRRIGIPRWLSLLGASPVAISLGLSLFLLSPSVSAQTAEELEKQYGREAMEKALETKHLYDLYGIHFDVDKATIRPETQPLFDDIAQMLKNFPMWRLRIVGHTDSTGDAAHNQLLSLQRANAVKSALVDRGIQASRLETEGAGQNQPVASNNTPEGRALNRRVALIRLDAKPNILFIMGDDIGWMQPSIYHRGLMVGETPNIDRIGQRRRDLHALLRRAELHGRAQCLLHRHASAAHRHDPAAAARAARPTCGPARRRSPGSCAISATTPASSARTTWATTPTRCRRRTASTSSGAISITSTRCRA